jgi:hypothetical protein
MGCRFKIMLWAGFVKPTINKSILMKHFEIVLEGGEDKVINLKELPKDELQKMLDIALEFENYEMCAHLKKYIDLLN